MKFQELNRDIYPNEVRSTYAVGKLTVNLTTRFSNEVKFEDALYQIVLQRLRSREKSKIKQGGAGHCDENVV